MKKLTKKSMAKNPVGRPPKFKTPQELQNRIAQYFQKCPDTKTIYQKIDGEIVEKKIPCLTITGLTLFLGFCDRAAFYDYEAKVEFRHTLKKARTFIELEYEKQIQTGNPTGAIFALKNFGWRDRPSEEDDAKHLHLHQHYGNVNITQLAAKDTTELLTMLRGGKANLPTIDIEEAEAAPIKQK